LKKLIEMKIKNNMKNYKKEFEFVKVYKSFLFIKGFLNFL